MRIRKGETRSGSRTARRPALASLTWTPCAVDTQSLGARGCGPAAVQGRMVSDRVAAGLPWPVFALPRRRNIEKR